MAAAIANAPRPHVRACAADALGELRNLANDEAIDALTGALGDRGAFVAYRAATALQTIGIAAQSTVRALRTAIRTHPDELARAGACEALGSMGAFAIETLPDLVAVVNGKDLLVVRRAALQAIGALGSNAGPGSQLARNLRAPEVMAAVIGATASPELAEEAFSAWANIDFDIKPELLAAATGRGPNARYATGSIARILARLLTLGPETISNDELKRAMAAAAASLPVAREQRVDYVTNQLATALVGLEREQDRRRARTIGIWSAWLSGLAIAVLAIAGTRRVHTLFLILLGRRWGLRTGEPDYVATVRWFVDSIRIEVAPVRSPEPREYIAAAPTLKEAEALCHDVHRNIPAGSSVRVRVDARGFHLPWARHIGSPWSDGPQIIVAGQVAALSSATPLRATHRSTRLSTSVLGCGDPGRGFDTLPNVQLELMAVDARFAAWGAATSCQRKATTTDFLDALIHADIVHVAAHATLAGIEFADRRISGADLPPAMLSGRCRLLVLSACDVGTIDLDASSLVFRLVSAGINVIAAQASVDSAVCRAFLEELYAALLPRRKARDIILCDAIRVAVRRCEQRFSIFEDNRWRHTLDAFVLFGDPTLHITFGHK